jgi:hypothetical protein
MKVLIYFDTPVYNQYIIPFLIFLCQSFHRLQSVPQNTIEAFLLIY